MRYKRAVAAATARGRRGNRVLVVCHGNICRSPYAAAVIRRALSARDMDVVSAGMIGPGRPVPDHAATTARSRGEDLTCHRSQLLSSTLVQSSHLILVMDPAQRTRVVRQHVFDPEAVVLLGDYDPQPIVKRAIRDPYAQTQDVFEDVFARIDRCAAVFAAAARMSAD